MNVRRILVADDFSEWRFQIRNLLERQPEWQIFEACHGGEAVQKATEFQPDVVLLDAGMPILNGIEAAGNIRETAPGSKILFVTQDGDEDLKAAALTAGAKAYLLKANAESEPAIESALHDATQA